MDQSSKREQILKIKSDPTLSEKEKNIKIQNLMSNNYLESNIIHKIKSNENKTCLHYTKKCSRFVFECCDIIDPCVRCHRERECCVSVKITVKEIMCNECGLKQKPHLDCDGCGVKFNKSYCEICCIWTDKDIFHCIDCGICRVGSAHTLTHCFDCAQCFSNNIPHICSKKNYKEGICVVCSESTYHSQSNSVLLPCSHFIHSSCLNKCTAQSNYKCPYCKKSICDMSTQWEFIRTQIKLHPIPNDIIPINLNDIVNTPMGKFQVINIFNMNNTTIYEGKFVDWFINKEQTKNVIGTLNSGFVKKNLYKEIHCNDCGKKSTSQFHFYGLECDGCGSFNTQE
jgi:hypothetical protein